jgi:phosphoribosylformylglycinamidine synthase I
MRFGVVIFPGSNCEQDVIRATRFLGFESEYIWHGDTDLSGFDAIVLPGGFSYGDYIRTGAVARFSPVMAEVVRFAEKGGPVLGICNGFQILTESGLLPGALMRNAGLKYICKQVHLRVETADSPFTGGLVKGEVLAMPIGHMEGNYFCTPEDLHRLEAEDRIAFRYATAAGQITQEANPNGSLSNIAGILNAGRNVLGMMPHPDRSSESLLGSADGWKIFSSMVEALTAQ